VTFPFYGLVGWDGPRWVEFFEGAAGHPVATLWLGHRRRDSRGHLSVGSSTDRGVPDIDTELAFAVAFALTERMRPDRATAPLPGGVQPRSGRSRPAGRRALPAVAGRGLRGRWHRVVAALLAFRRWLGWLRERDGRGQHQAGRRGYGADGATAGDGTRSGPSTTSIRPGGCLCRSWRRLVAAGPRRRCRCPGRPRSTPTRPRCSTRPASCEATRVRSTAIRMVLPDSLVLSRTNLHTPVNQSPGAGAARRFRGRTTVWPLSACPARDVVSAVLAHQQCLHCLRSSSRPHCPIATGVPRAPDFGQ